MINQLREIVVIFKAIFLARRIQDFFWNKPGERIEGAAGPSSYDAWIVNLDKRVRKLDEVDRSYWHWRVEATKRALQCAAVSIAFIWAIRSGSLEKDEP